MMPFDTINEIEMIIIYLGPMYVGAQTQNGWPSEFT